MSVLFATFVFGALLFLVFFRFPGKSRCMCARCRCAAPRLGGLQTIPRNENQPKPQFQIVAVPGLGAHPEFTWTSRQTENQKHGDESELENSTKDRCKRGPHLLKDLLPKSFTSARIVSFSYHSEWLSDASVTSPQKIGEELLKSLEEIHTGLPIIFICHSFGGIVVKQALCSAKEHSDIWRHTCGIIFLGTPHQGSSISGVASIIAYWTRFLGSSTVLLSALAANEINLTDLEERFRNWLQRRQDITKPVKLVAVRETKPQDYLGLPLGLIVNRDSAMSYATICEDWSCKHTDLNKFPGHDDDRYSKLEGHIRNLTEKPELERANEILLGKCYHEKELAIQGLSDGLPIENCYINLGLFKSNSGHGGARQGALPPQPSSASPRDPSSLKEPNQAGQVSLSGLFGQYKGGGENITKPRKILIRGCPGIGKSTLCKKIVFEVTRHKQWDDLFDHVLWIRLRRIRSKHNGQQLADLLQQEFFSQERDGSSLATQMVEEFRRNKFERVLFLLDGLDEIHWALGRDNDLYPLLQSLLSMPNIILTCRPHITIPESLIKPDMEAEVIGFRQQQVMEYVSKVRPSCSAHIHGFLQRNRLVQDLVRIPIHLDALCYIWDGKWAGEKGSQQSPRTMTELYKDIELKLWRRDLDRRDMRAMRENFDTMDGQIEESVRSDRQFLEFLAFAGLYSGTLEFDNDFRDQVYRHREDQTTGESHVTPLGDLSFLRTSHPPSESKNSRRTYHFIHLTFQEYFAARYFVRHWMSGTKLTWIKKKGKKGDLSTARFIDEHKYWPYYNVFWRFVSGLLQDVHLSSFFDALDNDRQDLVGLTHQRLLMHCLVEADEDLRCRNELENRLSKWARFQWQVWKIPELFREVEFPDHIIIHMLGTVPRDQISSFLMRLFGRGDLSDELLCAVGAHVDDMCAREILENHTNLPASVTQAVVERLENAGREIQVSAIGILGRQQVLPKDVPDLIVKLSNDEDVHIRLAVTKFFGSQLRDYEKISQKTQEAILRLRQDPKQKVRLGTLQFCDNLRNMPDNFLQKILRWCREDNKEVRLRSIDFLQSRMNLLEILLPSFVDDLSNKGEDIRSAAIGLFKSRDDLSETAVAHFISLLKHPNLGVRWNAVSVLAVQKMLPEEGQQAITSLFRGIDHNTWPEIDKICFRPTKRTTKLFVKTSEIFLQTLTALFKDKNDLALTCVCSILKTQKPFSAEVLGDIVTQLRHVDPVAKDLILVFNGPETIPEPVLWAISALLQHRDKRVRSRAISTLAKQDNLPPSVLPQGITMDLKNEQLEIRVAAVETVSALKLFPDGTTEVIRDLLLNTSHEVQIRVCRALENYRPLPKSILEALAGLWKHENEDVRFEARRIIRNISPPDLPIPTLQLLIELTRHNDEKIRFNAAVPFWGRKILPDSAVEAFIQRFEDDVDNVRVAAIRALSNCDSLPRRALEAITIMLQSSTDEVREEALDLIKSCGVRSQPLPNATVEALRLIFSKKNEEEDIRHSALNALEYQQIASTETLEAITRLLTDQSSRIRTAAMCILKKHETLPANSWKLITEAIHDTDSGSDIERNLFEMLYWRRDKSVPEELLREILCRWDNPDCRGQRINVLTHLEDIPRPLLSEAVRIGGRGFNTELLELLLDSCDEEIISSFFISRESTKEFFRYLFDRSLFKRMSMYFLDADRIRLSTPKSQWTFAPSDPAKFKEAIREARQEIFRQANEQELEALDLWAYDGIEVPIRGTRP
ncbi:peptidase C14 [Fusarium albosuccineum]|uniref:Peptidase C14 n=1 Tax=Fusarium albosuccineum TaxID=1237068 RepID=A0A8H4PC12_9HYPO|nr:peptidase C14 [Fusarium albosuccineum]